MDIVSIILLGLYSLLSLMPFNKNHKWISEGQIKQIVVRYDPKTLRVPGAGLPIGITTVLKNGDVTDTRGFLNGNTKWRNFRVEVEGGKFWFGKINIEEDNSYKKDDYIVVNIYYRKSKKLLHTQKIPYNYETEIELLTTGNYRKAPGNTVRFGIRTYYNNEMFTDFWPKNTGQLNKYFTVLPDGGSIFSGRLFIESDPLKIHNHSISVVALLNKDRSIGDTFKITLDYRDNYFRSVSGFSGTDGSSGWSGFSGSTGQNGDNGSNGEHGSDGSDGPDLDVFADVYYDTIINQQLMYVEIKKTFSNDCYRYLINTDGGSIRVVDYGGDGGDGGDGGSGGRGGNGEDGRWVTKTVKENDTVSKEITIQLRGRDGGKGGDGGYGGDGGNGGRGGDIHVGFTKNAEPFLFMIDAYSRGGDGGSRGDGGMGGSGGSGGSGNPSGSTGCSGRSGGDGRNGFDGYDGNVYYHLVGE